MKIAVPADGPSLEARVQNKLGTTPYLLVVDPDDMSFEVLDGPPTSLGSGAGVQALSIVLGKGANIILVGYISPNIFKPLQKNGIEVVTSVSGSVREAVTVWLVQMPVEVSVFGTRFTLIRNGVAFFVAIPTSILIVWLSGEAP